MSAALDTGDGLPVADITFAIGEVAAMLGLSPHTLRAWERRHVAVQPVRTDSGQRRYTADDVELLRQIKHERHVHGVSMRVATLTAQGVVVPDARESAPVTDAALAVESTTDPLRTVADLVSEVILVVDGEGRIAHANTTFVRCVGLLLGQLRGMALADLVEPFDRAKAVQAYQAPLRQRRDWELHLRTPHRELFFSFNCWPVSSGQGPMLVLVGRDLTAPAHARTAAEPSAAGEHRPEEEMARPRLTTAAQLCALLDGVADPVRTLRLVDGWLEGIAEGVILTGADPGLTVLFSNAAFRRLWPPACDPVEGRPLHEVAGAIDRSQLAIEGLEAIKTLRPRRLCGLRPEGDGDGPATWDVDLVPVAGVGSGVSHLALVIADVTAEAAAARRLHALVACGPAIRQLSHPQQLLREAAPYARELLANAGCLLALPGSGRAGVAVVATSGLWSRDGSNAGPDLRLALIRDAMRSHTSIEVERVGAESGIPETFRIVPLADPTASRAGEAPGALAFLRHGPGAFTPDDRQLIDEFAGRLGVALERSLVAAGPGAAAGRG